MKIHLSALGLVLLVVALNGCVTGELENRLDEMEQRASVAEMSFRAGEYDIAHASFNVLASEPTVSSPLYRLDSVPCLVLSGKKDEALRLMESLRVDFEELYDPESEKKALSKWHGEVNKVFKGTPHEMAAFYALMSLSYAEKGDYENAWRCVQNGLLHDTDAKEDKYQSDDALLLYLGSVYAGKIGEVDSVAQCRKRLRDILNVRGIAAADIEKCTKSAYAALLDDNASIPNAFVVVWSGTPPQFGRDGKYGEKRMVLKGVESAADFMTVSVDGGDEVIVPGKIGDINFQATTRGGREMDNILASKADFKQDMKNFQKASIGLSGLCFAAAFATFDTSEAGLIISGSLAAAGVTFLVLDGVFYCFYDKTDPRADIRAWKTLPGQLNVLPLRLTPGKHEISVRSCVGGDAMSKTTAVLDVPAGDGIGIAHIAHMSDKIFSDTLHLYKKTVELGNKNAPKEIVENYPETCAGGDTSAWYTLFGLDFHSPRFNGSKTLFTNLMEETLVRHGYAMRWSASSAIEGSCPPRPDKVLVCIGSYWNVIAASDGAHFLDTRVGVAVRGAGDCSPNGKFQTGSVKFFYAWSRQSTSGTNIGSITDAEKKNGVKTAIDNLFKIPEFRQAMQKTNTEQCMPNSNNGGEKK